MKRALLLLVVLVPLAGAIALAKCSARAARGESPPMATNPSEAEEDEVALVTAPVQPVAEREEAVADAPPEPEPRLEIHESVEEESSTNPERCIVLFRLLDPAGHALAERGFLVRTEFVSDRGSSWSQGGLNGDLRTDREGRGRVMLLTPWHPGATRALTAHVPEAGGALVGRIDLSRTLEPGLHDLGDVFAFPVPLLVEGRVVDVRGAPVADGEVTVERLRSGGWFPSLHRGVEVDGAFALYDEPSGDPVRLIVNAEGCGPSKPVAFAAGDRGLVVVLEAAATITGSIRLPGGAEALESGGGKLGRARCAVRITLHQGTTAPEERRISNLQTLHREGAFQFGNLPGGRFDLEIGLEVLRTARRAGGSRAQIVIPQPTAVVEIRGIEARPGETVRDPRLQEIDLSPLFAPR